MKAFLMSIICSSGAVLLAMEFSSKNLVELEKAQIGLATQLFTFDHRKEKEPVSSFMERLERCGKQYPEGPVWAVVQARLGDMHYEKKREFARQNNKLKEEDELALAKECYFRAYEHKQSQPEVHSWVALQLGYMALLSEEYEKAKQFFVIAESSLDERYKPHLYNGLGVAYYCSGEAKSAFTWWKKVIHSSNQIERARALHNCAILYEDRGNFSLALQCLKSSKQHGYPYDSQEFQVHKRKLEGSIKSFSSNK